MDLLFRPPRGRAVLGFLAATVLCAGLALLGLASARVALLVQAVAWLLLAGAEVLPAPWARSRAILRVLGLVALIASFGFLLGYVLG